jgi:hypothetical protein
LRAPAGSASHSVKWTPCPCAPHFHTFSLLSAALCVRARLLAGPRCHRLHAEWDGECCWKRRRIRRGERMCSPRVLGIRSATLLELVLGYLEQSYSSHLLFQTPAFCTVIITIFWLPPYLDHITRYTHPHYSGRSKVHLWLLVSYSASK